MHGALLILILASLSAFADRQTTGYRDAKDNARQGNQQQLQPQMMDHLAKAAQHLDKAKQAEQQQNHGQAEQERKMAQMEGQKAQQLNDQMKANEDSAKRNQDGQNQTRDNEENNANPLAGLNRNTGRPARESADYQRASTTVGRSPALLQSAATNDDAAAGSEPRLPADQLANLSAAAIPVRSPLTDPSTRAEESGSARAVPEETLTMISTPKNTSAESSTALAPSPPANSTTAVETTADFSVKASEPLAPPAVTDRLLASAKPTKALDKDADFFKAARKAGDSEEMRLEGAPLADNTPGRKLSDKVFWQKAGGEPATCRVRGKQTQAKARQHTRCLRDARRRIENRLRRDSLAAK